VDGTTLTFLIVPGLATGVGGLVLFALRRPSARTLDGMLGFTAGVMLAAAAFGLLVPAIERGGLLEISLGLATGSIFLLGLDIAVPHAHARFAERGRASVERQPATQRAILLVSALTIHNLPEGMAVGLAFAAGGSELGIPVAVAIAIQNVPEGFAAAAPLLGAGLSRAKAVGVAFLTGAVEPPAALATFATSRNVETTLPFALAFAAGAMLYVVVDELIPESQARGYERVATMSLLGGFVLMLVLDSALG
jgi:zinc transporter, ZIP family